MKFIASRPKAGELYFRIQNFGISEYFRIFGNPKSQNFEPQTKDHPLWIPIQRIHIFCGMAIDNLVASRNNLEKNPRFTNISNDKN